MWSNIGKHDKTIESVPPTNEKNPQENVDELLELYKNTIEEFSSEKFNEKLEKNK